MLVPNVVIFLGKANTALEIYFTVTHFPSVVSSYTIILPTSHDLIERSMIFSSIVHNNALINEIRRENKISNKRKLNEDAGGTMRSSGINKHLPH